MKVSEAPPAGWYPDPRGRVRLRWWDGTDWTDQYRSRPPGGTAAAGAAVDPESGQPLYEVTGAYRRPSRNDTAEIVAQVRKAAREELDRAADLFSQRARAAVRELPPLISSYTSKLLKWVKIILIVAAVLAAFFLIFQAVAQVSFFEWLGDRIDSIRDGDQGG